MKALQALLTVLVLVSPTVAKCYDPSPAFPLPLWEHDAQDLEPALTIIGQKLRTLVSDEKYDNSSFSVEITSNTETLWSHFHTARKQNSTRTGVTQVDGNSQYRIASITKTFTTLAVLYQHAAGNLSLDDPVDRYISELAEGDTGDIPWKDITLRIMASQLSGIPRETLLGVAGDLIGTFADPTELGLPPPTRERLPDCHGNNCTRKDMLDNLKSRQPIYAPNQKSTYSNANFELLGLVIENVTGIPYNDYIDQTIFQPLNMTLSSLTTPPDTHAVLPLGNNYWDVDEGLHGPTGGIYSSATDMSKYIRYIMTHFNALATGVNWFMPASWSEGMNSFYGMPFEIFRTDKVLPESRRPVTLVTKSGSLPMYYSQIIMLPEYGLGITVLTAGHQGLIKEIPSIMFRELIPAAEKVAWRDVDKMYSGTYSAIDSSLNSSLSLSAAPSSGLALDHWISNSTDMFASLVSMIVEEGSPWHVQLTPTLLYKNETSQQGEIWRFIVVYEREDEFCLADVDLASYDGLPLNEMVFWHEQGVLELPAFRVKMRREQRQQEKLVVQTV